VIEQILIMCVLYLVDNKQHNTISKPIYFEKRFNMKKKYMLSAVNRITNVMMAISVISICMLIIFVGNSLSISQSLTLD